VRAILCSPCHPKENPGTTATKKGQHLLERACCGGNAAAPAPAAAGRRCAAAARCQQAPTCRTPAVMPASEQMMAETGRWRRRRMPAAECHQRRNPRTHRAGNKHKPFRKRNRAPRREGSMVATGRHAAVACITRNPPSCNPPSGYEAAGHSLSGRTELARGRYRAYQVRERFSTTVAETWQAAR
jgi:hypothetical protein